MQERFATGVSEARSPKCRGKKTPTLVSPAREGIELEVNTQVDPPKRSSSVVKHSVPRSCRTEP